MLIQPVEGIEPRYVMHISGRNQFTSLRVKHFSCQDLVTRHPFTHSSKTIESCHRIGGASDLPRALLKVWRIFVADLPRAFLHQDLNLVRRTSLIGMNKFWKRKAHCYATSVSRSCSKSRSVSRSCSKLFWECGGNFVLFLLKLLTRFVRSNWNYCWQMFLLHGNGFGLEKKKCTGPVVSVRVKQIMRRAVN